MPHLFRVVVPVPDMAVADAFYARLLGLEVDAVAATRHYLHCGGTILALVDPSGPGRPFRPNPEVLYLAVPDLAAGAQPLDALDADDVGWGIQQRVWGERSA